MAAAARTTWPQVLAWRLRRHLLDPVTPAGALDIVRRLCGVQAQVPAAAALAVGLRQAEPVPDAVDRALRDGQLLRTWAVRGTLHLLTPDEAGAYLSLLAAGRGWEKGSWVRTFGVTPDEMVTLVEAVTDVLDGQVLTREQLVSALGDRLGRADFAAQLRSGWGTVLKPVAWQGALCHGPADGNRVTFARPDQLLPGWKGLPEPDDAARVVIPAYLGAHGPATVERFDAWLIRGTSRQALLRGWFAAVDDLLVTVDVEGTSAYLRADDLDELLATEPAEPAAPGTPVRLLGGFDQYVLGPGTAATEIIAPDRRAAISRAGGWIAPVVVAGGRVVGTWELDAGNGAVGLDLFDDGDPVDPAGLAAAVERVRSVLARLKPD
jgi:hypothetical protein